MIKIDEGMKKKKIENEYRIKWLAIKKKEETMKKDCNEYKMKCPDMKTEERIKK